MSSPLLRAYQALTAADEAYQGFARIAGRYPAAEAAAELTRRLAQADYQAALKAAGPEAQAELTEYVITITAAAQAQGAAHE